MRSPHTTGKLEADGTMHVTLCDFIEPWESTSATQKKSLTQRYEMGCDCKVKLKDSSRVTTIILVDALFCFFCKFSA